MPEQNIVSITIEEDLQSHQENTSLKIELDEDTTIQQLLEYLIEQEKIVVDLNKIEVLSGQHVISNNSLIKDPFSNGNKIDLIIRVKNNKNIPPPPKQNPVVVQNQKNPMNISNIEITNFEIPVTGSLDQSKLNQKQQQQKQLQKQKQQKQKANFIAAQQVAQQKVPKPGQQMLTLVIGITDGSSSFSIDFQVGATQCWEDIKPRLFDYISTQKYLDNWSKQQEIKLQSNGHTYKKARIPFKNLNMAINGKIKFQITRIFPGGSL